MTHGQHRRKCVGKRRDGSKCEGPAMTGFDRCRLHVGISSAKAKARGLVVTELAGWGLDDQIVDPGLVLLQLVAQAARRVGLYSMLLEQAYGAGDKMGLAYDRVGKPGLSDEDTHEAEAAVRAAEADVQRVFKTGGVGALIGFRWGVDRDGNLFKVEEAIRGLVRLEAEERDRCAQMAAKAVAAGLAERQVKLAEQQGMLIVTALRRIADRIQLSPEQMVLFAEVAGEELRAITGAVIPGEVVDG